MNNSYRASKYERQAQRFIYPLFTKDGIGGYDFSSTMTFVKYNEQFFSIFAAHALPQRENLIEKIGVLGIDGSFMSLCKVTQSYKKQSHAHRTWL